MFQVVSGLYSLSILIDRGCVTFFSAKGQEVMGRGNAYQIGVQWRAPSLLVTSNTASYGDFLI